MCLAIPGQVMEASDIDGIRVGKVEFGGIRRDVYLDFVPDVTPGDYVLVHVGFAISKIDREEADRTLHMLEDMGALEEELVINVEP